MYSAEQLFEAMSYKELHDTLKCIANEDCYLTDFLEDSIESDFIYMLDVYDLIYIASDDRLLLTQKGERALQCLISSVELYKN